MIRGRSGSCGRELRVTSAIDGIERTTGHGRRRDRARRADQGGGSDAQQRRMSSGQLSEPIEGLSDRQDQSSWMRRVPLCHVILSTIPRSRKNGQQRISSISARRAARRADHAEIGGTRC
jgi:hypothetical protein